MKIFIRLVLIAGLLCIASIPSSARGEFPFFENPLVGQAAPDFTLKTLQGTPVNMTRFRENKSAVIFFWATWCPHCRAALKELNKETEQMEKKGIKLILVDLGEGAKEVGAYVSRNQIGLTVFLDEDSFLSDPYAIIGVPTFVLVDQQGIVRAVEHALPENYEDILLPKKNPTP
jgi:peroxiredoxin